MKITNRKRKYTIIIASFLLFFTLSEIVLRFFFGFCDTVLFKADPNFEYIFQPNQSRFRFGHHIRINEYSMRGEPLQKYSLKILGLGDSVIDGGAKTEQDSLATSRLSKSFSLLYDTSIQVLSVGVPSWGPDNCAAYLKKYGDFDSKIIFMVVSSHDAFDVMTFKPIVGLSPLYPEKQYVLGLYELWDRVYRKLSAPVHDDSGIEKDGKEFNPGFDQILALSKKHKIPLIIYLHPTMMERKNGVYSLQGKKIIEFTMNNKLTLIRELDYKFGENEYRDFIHLNERGQKHMYDILYPVLNTELHKVIDK